MKLLLYLAELCWRAVERVLKGGGVSTIFWPR